MALVFGLRVGVLLSVVKSGHPKEISINLVALRFVLSHFINMYTYAFVPDRVYAASCLSKIAM